MNRHLKRLTCKYFTVEAGDQFFPYFAATFNTLQASEKRAQSFNARDSRCYLKPVKELSLGKDRGFLLLLVRERNTWQCRAAASGSISSPAPKQGILGDTNYILLNLDRRLLTGFS